MKLVRLAQTLFVLGTVSFCYGAEPVSVTLDNTSLVERKTPLLTGVGVHFGIGGERGYIPSKTVEALTELGVDSFRDDITWNSFDPNGNGTGNKSPRLFNFLRMAPQRPLLIIGQSNPKIPQANPPVTDEGRRRFDAFVADVMQATAQFHPIFEIWNEWNLSVAKLPKKLVGPGDGVDPRAAVNYARLASSAVAAAQAANPSAQVIYGGVGEDPDWKWLRAMVAEAKLSPKQPLSIHLYNHCAPPKRRTATEMVDRLNQLQSILGRQQNPQPILVTEFGWPNSDGQCGGVPEKVVADNAAQFLLWASATPWMTGAWIYELKDSGRDKADREQSFGIFDFDYRPKPVACSVREAIKLIKSSKRFKLMRPTTDLFVLQLESQDGLRFVTWHTSLSQDSKLYVDGSVTARPLCGTETTSQSGAINVSSVPTVIELRGENHAALRFTTDR